MAIPATFVAILPICLPVLRAWRRRRRLEKGVCGGCGYNLQGMLEGRCPECGLKYDAKQTYERRSTT